MKTSSYHILGLTKEAANRREFLAMLLRNTMGGAAAGAAYKGGLRPLVKGLKHEIGSPTIIKGTTAGPFSGPSVGPDDLKAWEDAQKAMGDKLSVNWGPEAPEKHIDLAKNLAGHQAMSAPGQLAARNRFLKLETTKGALGGAAAGSTASLLSGLFKHLKGTL